MPTASYTSPWEGVAAVSDGIDPPSSNDTVNRRRGTWPNTGSQWAELAWASAQTIKSAEVYFFDDGGGVRVPASWKLQRWTGSAYADVPGTYPIAADAYNTITFATAVSTTRLRVVLQSGQGSVGLLEIKAWAADPPGGGTGWNPPAGLVTPLNAVWQHVESTYPNLYGFRNYGWGQVMANGGSLNYCVRWDTGATVTAAQRDQIHVTLARQVKKWMDLMRTPRSAPNVVAASSTRAATIPTARAARRTTTTCHSG
ncbi:hypothetical protein AB0C27_47510 [Nonomuraea sp. NPDC048882]|uniref:hypothetical protein n=1 Tax=Nonomuraea sp. NPDC048882 TaxID=3154347 RepID=UPI0033F68269